MKEGLPRFAKKPPAKPKEIMEPGPGSPIRSAVVVLFFLALAILLAALHLAGRQANHVNLLSMAGAAACIALGVRLLRMRRIHPMTDVGRTLHTCAAAAVFIGALFLFFLGVNSNPAASAVGTGLIVELNGITALMILWVQMTRRDPPPPERSRQSRPLRWMYAFALLCIVPVFLLWGLAIGVQLGFVGRLYVNLISHGHPNFYLPPISYGVPLLFYGIGAALPMTLGVMKLAFPRTFPRFLAYMERRGDHAAMLAFIFVVCSGIATLALPFMLDSYVVFREDHIACNDFLTLGEQRYSYDDVAAVYLKTHWERGPRDEIVEMPGIAVRLLDGRMAVADGRIYRAFDPANDPALAEQIARRAGLTVQHVRLLPWDEPVPQRPNGGNQPGSRPATTAGGPSG